MSLHELDHLLAHGDRLLVHVTTVDGVPLAVCMIDHGFNFLGGNGIYNIPEVSFIAGSALINLWWQKWLYLRSFRVLCIECLHGKLGVTTCVHRLDLTLG